MKKFFDNSEISENFRKFKDLQNISKIFGNFLIDKNCSFFCSPEAWTEKFFQSCFSLICTFLKVVRTVRKVNKTMWPNCALN